MPEMWHWGICQLLWGQVNISSYSSVYTKSSKYHQTFRMIDIWKFDFVFRLIGGFSLEKGTMTIIIETVIPIHPMEEAMMITEIGIINQIDMIGEDFQTFLWNIQKIGLQKCCYIKIFEAYFAPFNLFLPFRYDDQYTPYNYNNRYSSNRYDDYSRMYGGYGGTFKLYYVYFLNLNFQIF